MTQKTTHSVYALYYHIILTTKYRKKIIEQYDDDLKQIILDIATTKNFRVEKMESDQDHIHILVSAKPNISPYSIVTAIKQKTTYELWNKYPNQLRLHFWKDHVFWTKSYFVNSIGSVSKDAIMKYIENQGGSSAALKDMRACRLTH